MCESHIRNDALCRVSYDVSLSLKYYRIYSRIFRFSSYRIIFENRFASDVSDVFDENRFNS